MELDLGGIVKEYAADRAAALCRDAGVRGGFVNLGGDISIVGPAPGRSTRGASACNIRADPARR